MEHSSSGGNKVVGNMSPTQIFNQINEEARLGRSPEERGVYHENRFQEQQSAKPQKKRT